MPTVDDLVARLRLDSAQFDRGLRGVQVSLGRMERQTAGLTKGVGNLGRGFLALGAGSAAFGGLKSAIAGASGLNETMSKSNTIFGENAKAIEDWAAGGAVSFGQSKQQALEAAATFGNLFTQLGIGTDQAAGMSQQMVELASDFASFHQAAPVDVLNAMTAAFRGEYDAVQRFVPTITAATVEQKALSLGLARTTKELDAQDKALATQRLLLDGAGAAAGDFDRTSDSLANQQLTLAANFENATSQLGGNLMPAMTTFVTFLNDSVIPKVSETSEKIAGMFGGGKPGLNDLEKGMDVLFEFFNSSDKDRKFGLSDDALAGLQMQWSAAEEEDLRKIAARAEDKKATEAAAQAARNLAQATGRTARQDEEAADAAEKLTRAKESLAQAHRNVEDAVFDLADAEDDLRETEFREGSQSEAADKARREVGKARLRVLDAQAAVARDVRDVSEANKKAAETIATSMDKMSTSVDNLTKAIPAAVAAVQPPAVFGPDVPAVGAGSLAPAATAGSLAPGAVGVGGLQGAQITVGPVYANDPRDAAATINRELDWITRGGSVT